MPNVWVIAYRNREGAPVNYSAAYSDTLTEQDLTESLELLKDAQNIVVKKVA